MKYRIVMLAMAALLVSGRGGWTDEPAKPHWSDTITLKGDLRTRYEYIDEEGKDVRHRFRIRARVGLDAQINEEVDVHLRLASGDADPVSSNQTLGDGFSSKDFQLDQAFFDWHPAKLDGLNFLGGKMENPFVRVRDLLWDDDLTPEGFALKLATQADKVKLMANLGVFMAEERTLTDDAYIYGGQLAAEMKPEAFTLLGGVGYFYFDNFQGYTTLYDPLKAFGNSTVKVTDPDTGEVTELLYAEKYGVAEALARLTLNTRMPVSFYANGIVNTEADSSEDTGYLFGLTLGKAREPGSFELDYHYRHIEADAAVGLFVDSDVGGGGTDIEGHRIQGKYQISKNWQGVATLVVSDRNISSDESDYIRSQFDLVASF
jgi:hypothetical protein